MRVKVTQVLKGYDNDNLTDAKGGPDSEAVTLRKAMCEALTVQFAGETIDGEEKVRRFELARKVFNEDSPDLLETDIKQIKALVGKAFGPAVVGPVWALLPDKIEEPAKDEQPEPANK